MDYFRNSGLYEGYGSTECGWVTMLQPEEQFSKLGSVGRECIGSRPIRLLDRGRERRAGGRDRASSIPAIAYTFDGYWKLPEKTREAFRGDYCTVGDLARRDEDGFLYLVDRKTNMIISGGENVYPSEVEGVLGGHPKVKDVAVIGVADEKWGERVHAVIVPHDGRGAGGGGGRSNGAGAGLPAISGRGRSRSSATTRCRAPRPAKFCTACSRKRHEAAGRLKRSASRGGQR